MLAMVPPWMILSRFYTLLNTQLPRFVTTNGMLFLDIKLELDPTRLSSSDPQLERAYISTEIK